MTSSGARVGGMSLARIGEVPGLRKAMIAAAQEEARDIGTEMVHVRGSLRPREGAQGHAHPRVSRVPLRQAP